MSSPKQLSMGNQNEEECRTTTHLHRRFFTSPRTWILDLLDLVARLFILVWLLLQYAYMGWRNNIQEGEGFVHPMSLAFFDNGCFIT
jgi:hypothetical protein